MSSSILSTIFNVNISDFITKKLDMANYLTWSYLFRPVNNHISSSPVPPHQFLPGTDADASNPNLEYLLWCKVDRLILSWINTTVKCGVLHLLYHSTTASEACTALSNHFLDKSTTREMQLKLALDHLRKNDLSIEILLSEIQETN